MRNHRPSLLFGFALALAAPPASRLPAQQAPAPRIVERTVRSREYGRPRRYWVHVAPDYDAAADHPLLLAFDGSEWIETGRPRAMDSLRALGRLPSFVTVLVDDSSGAARLGDLANHERFVRFVVNELLPAVRREWRVTADPHRAVVAGSSAGGLAASFVALRHPEVFGNVLSQSGGYWRGAAGSSGAPFEWLATQVDSLPKRDVRFVLDVGALETGATLGGAGPVFIDAVRRFRDRLRAKGYDVVYTEVPGGRHDPASWTPRVPVDLLALAGTWPR